MAMGSKTDHVATTVDVDSNPVDEESFNMELLKEETIEEETETIGETMTNKPTNVVAEDYSMVKADDLSDLEDTVVSTKDDKQVVERRL